MTMREIDISLKKIAVRDHNTFAMRASLHGITIPKITQAATLENHEEMSLDNEAVSEALNAALERKKQEMNSGPK